MQHQSINHGAKQLASSLGSGITVCEYGTKLREFFSIGDSVLTFFLKMNESQKKSVRNRPSVLKKHNISYRKIVTFTIQYLCTGSIENSEPIGIIKPSSQRDVTYKAHYISLYHYIWF